MLTAGLVRECVFADNGANGLNCTSVLDMVIERNQSTGNVANGIAVAGRGVVLRDNQIGRNGQHGIALYGDSTAGRYGGYRLLRNQTDADAQGGLWRSPRLGPGQVEVQDNTFS